MVLEINYKIKSFKVLMQFVSEILIRNNVTTLLRCNVLYYSPFASKIQDLRLLRHEIGRKTEVFNLK